MGMSEAGTGQDGRAGMLSVVIPIGGVDQWLDESVASVLSDEQLDLELIAVFNNGADVPENWRFLEDPRVRVIHTSESLGPAGAGQRGIDAARGEFLVCLDADDVMLPERMQSQLEWMRRHPETVLVSSQVDWINEVGERVGAFELPTGPDVRAALLKLNVAPHSSWMVRLSAVRQVGGYDTSMRQMEDYDLLLRLSLLGPVAVLPETLTHYRLHDDQMSRAVRPNGDYVRTIRSGRRRLGEELGMSRARVARSGLWWEVQQWLMFWGRKVRLILRQR